MHDVKKFFWDEPYLYMSCVDGLIRRFMPEVQMLSVFEACHSSLVGRHHCGIRTTHIVLQCGYYSKPSTKMLMSSPRHVIDTKEMMEFQESKSFL